MIPPHIIFANPNWFDLETLSNIYNTNNKEWISYCETVKDIVIQQSFEPYQFLHEVSITSKNTLFQLIPLKKYLQTIMDLKDRKLQSFPKKIPNLFISKFNQITMNEVYPTLLILLKLQIYMSEILSFCLPEKDLYPYKLLNLVLVYQALEKICIDYKFKDLIEHNAFIQAFMYKSNSFLSDELLLKDKYKKMNRDTVYIYYHCIRYIRRVKRMFYKMNI